MCIGLAEEGTKVRLHNLLQQVCILYLSHLIFNVILFCLLKVFLMSWLNTNVLIIKLTLYSSQVHMFFKYTCSFKACNEHNYITLVYQASQRKIF